MLEHIKDAPINIFKTCLFYFDKKYTWPKKNANINVIVIFFTYCGSTKCSQPVWGHESCKQCYFSLMLHIYTGAVGKKRKPIYTRYFFNSVSISKND